MINKNLTIRKRDETVKQLSIARNKELLLKALEDNRGVVTYACKQAGVSRGTYWAYYKDDPEFATKCNEMKEVALDFAEHKLFELIDQGSPAATIFYLKCLGKGRNYIEKTELTISQDLNLDYQIPLLPPSNILDITPKENLSNELPE